jgi:hypothetical protein
MITDNVSRSHKILYHMTTLSLTQYTAYMYVKMHYWVASQLGEWADGSQATSWNSLVTTIYVSKRSNQSLNELKL